MKRSFPVPQRGLALIMAVLIAALAVTAVAFAAWRQQVRLREAQLRNDSIQAQLLLRASITIARTALMDDLRDDVRNGSNGRDYPKERLFTHRENTNVEKGHASGHIEDASGRLNLNELVDAESNPNPIRVVQYGRLLQVLGLDPTLADRLVDWMDKDDQVRPNGAEENDYLALSPPYRPANRPLGTLAELLDIKGYTSDVVERLRPHVDVFPPMVGNAVATINMNFCSPELLMAVFPGLNKGDAISLVKAVEQRPYEHLGDFIQRLPQALRPLLQQPAGLPDQTVEYQLQNTLVAESRYFYADLKLSYGQVQWKERVLLYRRDADATQVIARRRLAE